MLDFNCFHKVSSPAKQYMKRISSNRLYVGNNLEMREFKKKSSCVESIEQSKYRIVKQDLFSNT